MIKENYTKTYVEQHNIICDQLKEYQADEVRRDDITVLGVKI